MSNMMDTALKQRAHIVLPSLTHMDTTRLLSAKDAYSQFFASGKGCRVTDVDGKTYISYMASYGPILLGHQHDAVEAAVKRQMQQGDCLEGPAENMVSCAELLVRTIPMADWVYFAKNGSDATAIAVRIARASTHKKIVLRAPHSYHGSLAMWQEGPHSLLVKQGITAADSAHMLPYTYNNLASVQAAIAAGAGDIACMIVAAFKWDYANPQEVPTRDFLVGVRELCNKHNIVLICDDIRSSLRIHPGGSWEKIGFGVQPDLLCLCKGIANGYALSAVAGQSKLRKGASRIVATGSFWASAVPFAAALATIPLAGGACTNMERLGDKLREALAEQADRHGLGHDFMQTGPSQMPFFDFKSERKLPMQERIRILQFCKECAARGVWFHPFHTMFFTGAHTDVDIQATLLVTDEAFKIVARMPPVHEKIMQAHL